MILSVYDIKWISNYETVAYGLVYLQPYRCLVFVYAAVRFVVQVAIVEADGVDKGGEEFVWQTGSGHQLHGLIVHQGEHLLFSCGGVIVIHVRCRRAVSPPKIGAHFQKA